MEAEQQPQPQPQPQQATKLATAWADMDQDVDDESEPLVVEMDGTTVATMYYREADGRQMKKEKRYKVHRKVLKVPKAVREREQAWKKFGYEALDFTKNDNKKFMTSTSASDEQMILPKIIGDMEPNTGLETQTQRRLLTDIKKLFDTLVHPDPSAVMALAEKDEAQAAAAAAAPMERQGRADSDDRTVRVSNLPEYTTDEELGKLFSRIGPVVRTYLARHKETNVSKGFAFITFKTRENAQQAVNELHKKGFQNVLLNIEWAKKKSNP
eukprot:Protomagalhaensia_wolfi_Nauph_80__1189@NODE_1701_length_1390_cov_74_227979_g1321_i0_p1_GENE_NODE_1701_length_1390_cov_74_227979_g1321_i0NODE_1701_length_1390_cov_74_227979_g1321_i0_p1_ORF_typecomplete_len296_score57_74RRM_1/PF00076_22/5_5e03RRM_1/PF00076_22/4e20eIF3g/PF12353_8/9_3e09RRM_5/PF13893_6/4_1e08RRM_7/PF16367_5/6_4e03RRM_7/PF16367_5/2_1e05PHM7_cyt/PF14703_6/5_8e03PHM7_cyt/PF14703_6/11PHM7_cyt/PF14703_6/4_3PHM7_cyt/PF14703_6/0_022RRM_Rrp7/PF17799_1/3_5e02RRM_Rrp7/PF17799_1/0_00065Nup35_R